LMEKWAVVTQRRAGREKKMVYFMMKNEFRVWELEMKSCLRRVRPSQESWNE
jgi:hypothetical protein